MENNNARSILLFDGHLNYVHQEIKQLLSFEDIECIDFPPHSSHITQPLDQSFFCNVKRNYRALHIID